MTGDGGFDRAVEQKQRHCRRKIYKGVSAMAGALLGVGKSANFESPPAVVITVKYHADVHSDVTASEANNQCIPCASVVPRDWAM